MGALKLTYTDENYSTLKVAFRKSDGHEKKGANLGYFGARYYDSDLSIWLSVDPLADKYPSMSAYMYTAGNPVMLVDPDGRKVINVHKKQLANAKVNLEKTKKKFESFRDKKGKGYRKAKRDYRRAKRDHTYYQKKFDETQTAISDLKKYNKNLYDDLDDLKDESGNTVDVYVKDVNKLQTKNGGELHGKTTTKHSGTNFFTKYGRNTVLIEIDARSVDKGKTLSHEGGHASYNVRNWKSYISWLKLNPGASYGGHGGGNPSGLYADKMEMIYNENKRKQK